MNVNTRPFIVLNGKDSRYIQGLLITELPPISKPKQRTKTETIDGRDGDIITRLGYSAYDKTLKIGLTYDYSIDDLIGCCRFISQEQLNALIHVFRQL